MERPLVVGVDGSESKLVAVDLADDGAGEPATSTEVVRFAFREAEARTCVLDVVRARRRGVTAGRTAVVEDAPAGVEAGRRGGFGPVVGVHRAAGPGAGERLLRHGADILVRDLGEPLTQGASP